MLFSTAKVPQMVFITDLYCGVYGVQSILHKTEYQEITNSQNKKSLYWGTRRFRLDYIE